CMEVRGGNSGMTKGGTGDVLAGLIAALATKNDPFLATIAGSFINKKAGDALYKKVGPFFNASDLADEIPKVMKEVLT
ncbi:MAG: NAD(P)H-hydrate dehydratase, partial [Patescibacteria group bacterium]